MSHLYEIPARSRNSRAGFLYTERMRRWCRICGVFSEEKRKQKNAADLQHHLCCTPAAYYYPDSFGDSLLFPVYPLAYMWFGNSSPNLIRKSAISLKTFIPVPLFLVFTLCVALLHFSPLRTYAPGTFHRTLSENQQSLLKPSFYPPIRCPLCGTPCCCFSLCLKNITNPLSC